MGHSNAGSSCKGKRRSKYKGGKQLASLQSPFPAVTVFFFWIFGCCSYVISFSNGSIILSMTWSLKWSFSLGPFLFWLTLYKRYGIIWVSVEEGDTWYPHRLYISLSYSAFLCWGKRAWSPFSSRSEGLALPHLLHIGTCLSIGTSHPLNWSGPGTDMASVKSCTRHNVIVSTSAVKFSYIKASSASSSLFMFKGSHHSVLLFIQWHCWFIGLSNIAL